MLVKEVQMLMCPPLQMASPELPYAGLLCDSEKGGRSLALGEEKGASSSTALLPPLSLTAGCPCVQPTSGNQGRTAHTKRGCDRMAALLLLPGHYVPPGCAGR